MLGLAIDRSRLTIRMDPGSLSVGYGIMRSLLRWEDVEGCEEDKGSPPSGTAASPFGLPG